MKWPIVGLFGLGLVAAVCAGVLAASMQGGRGPGAVAAPEATEVSVVVAARPLDPMAVVQAADVAVRTLSKAAAPEGAFADPVQVVGRVLLVPVTEGQALKGEVFAADGSNAHLAAALGQGRRAVNIPVTNSMGIEELLYPGCFVDVLFSTNAQGNEERARQPVSVTLLQKVQVLAVGNRTIVAPDGPAADEESAASLRSRAPRVTLLVDGRQAEALNLAMQEGVISLALRNPNDESSPEPQGTLMASLLPFLGWDPADPAPSAPAAAPRPPVDRTWETVIVRGGERETKTFNLGERRRDG